MNNTKIREFRVFWAAKMGKECLPYSTGLRKPFLNVCSVRDLRKTSIKKMLNEDQNTVLNFSPKCKLSKQNTRDMAWQ